MTVPGERQVAVPDGLDGERVVQLEPAGAAFAEVGHATLLIDLDPQANSTSGLGLDPARARLNIYHLLTGEATLDQVIQPTSVAGLSLVPAHIDLAGAINYQTGIRQVLERASARETAAIAACSGFTVPETLGPKTMKTINFQSFT